MSWWFHNHALYSSNRGHTGAPRVKWQSYYIGIYFIQFKVHLQRNENLTQHCLDLCSFNRSGSEIRPFLGFARFETSPEMVWRSKNWNISALGSVFRACISRMVLVQLGEQESGSNGIHEEVLPSWFHLRRLRPTISRTTVQYGWTCWYLSFSWSKVNINMLYVKSS